MSKKRIIILISIALFVLTAVAFEQALFNDFVRIDDTGYVTENPHIKSGINYGSVIWAFGSTYASNWHPLTWLSHMLDHSLFGLDPWGHHLTSLLFHIVNALLLFWILYKLTGSIGASSFIAFVFALHPLRVESVVWISERKDVLSAFFWMLTLAAYIRFVKRPGIGRYGLVFAAFALGLTAKPMLVTLPFVLLLLDYWPLNRLKVSAVYEKIPLFLLAAISCAITYYAQQASGSVIQIEKLPFLFRLFNAVISYAGYIAKMFYPVDLAVLYPYPIGQTTVMKFVLCLLFLVIVSIIILSIPKKRFLLVGWLWYLGTLVPVIGLIQVGGQAMADRYTYLPSIGILIIIVFSIKDLFAERHHKMLKVPACVILLILLLCTRNQVTLWRDSITLYEHTLSVTKNNFVIHNWMGSALTSQDRIDEAIGHFQKSIKIMPKYSKSHYNMGIALQKDSRLPEALEQFRIVERLDPEHYKALNNIGVVLQGQSKYTEAIEYYKKAAQVKPDFGVAFYNMAKACIEMKEIEKGIAYFNEAIEIDRDDPKFHAGLAEAFAEKGDLSGAVASWNESLRADPDQMRIHTFLVELYILQNKLNLALEYFSKVITLEPDSSGVFNNLAWIMATCKREGFFDPARAVDYAERACEMEDNENADYLDTLAAAYASSGQFGRAIVTARKALDLHLAGGEEIKVKQVQDRLELYEQSKSFIRCRE